MKKLFVSYKVSRGFGNCVVELEDGETIDGIEDIRRLQKVIALNKGLDDVTIDNMIMLPII